MQVDELMKLAKKHKKLFEEFSLNPFAFVINGHHFYLANYKKRGRVVCNAVISLDSNNKKEHLAALKWLTIFSSFITNIITIIGERAKIDFTFMHNLDHYVQLWAEKNSNEKYVQKVEKVRNGFKQILDLQDELVSNYRLFEERYTSVKEKGYFAEEDFAFVIKKGAELDRYQFLQMYIQYSFVEDCHEIFSFMKETKWSQPKDRENKKILKEMGSKKTKEEFEKLIEDFLEGISDGKYFLEKTKEEQVKLLEEAVLKSGEELYKEVMADLRYPK